MQWDSKLVLSTGKIPVNVIPQVPLRAWPVKCKHLLWDLYNSGTQFQQTCCNITVLLWVLAASLLINPKQLFSVQQVLRGVRPFEQL